MKGKNGNGRYVLCVENCGYPASLEVRKVYRVIPDVKAFACGRIRVVDESGGDYLYPAAFFIPIEVPKAAGKFFASAAAG